MSGVMKKITKTPERITPTHRSIRDIKFEGLADNYADSVSVTSLGSIVEEVEETDDKGKVSKVKKTRHISGEGGEYNFSSEEASELLDTKYPTLRQMIIDFAHDLCDLKEK